MIKVIPISAAKVEKNKTQKNKDQRETIQLTRIDFGTFTELFVLLCKAATNAYNR